MQIWHGIEGRWIEVEEDFNREILDYINRLYQIAIENQKTITEQEEMIKSLEEIIEQVPKTAGRNQKLNLNQKENIRKMRKQGVPLQEIADHYQCSLPTVHKITKDIEVDLRRKGSQKAHIKKG